MKSWRILGLVLVAISALLLLAAACGDDEDEGDGAPTATDADGASPAGGGEVELELTAQNTSYDKDELTAEVGADVKLTFNNKDNGIQHNFALYENKDSDEELFEGDIITGPETTTYEFTAPEEPGTYFFHCDIHPSLMQGDFVVE
jgi:plastocyanin